MAPRLTLNSCFGRRSSDLRNSVNPKHQVDKVTTTEPRKLSPLVVELFSSQGCTTSPEAEAVFSRLGRGDFNSKFDAPLILLAYHVDYWDYMGWKDPFASSQWTVRQKAYVEALNLDTMFTPQIVVQGRAQCIANDPDAILSCIAAAERVAAPALQAAFQKTAEALQVTVTGSLKWKPGDEGVYVMVALYECGLVTDCGSGPNKGKVLANDYIVRRLEKLCSLGKNNKSINGMLSLPLWEGFNQAKSGLAVFLQNSSHHIFGSQNFRLPDNM